MRLALALVMLLAAVSSTLAQSRIKDIATVEGVRDNALTGNGVVVGLAGTGDSASRGMATVAVSAVLPPFARPGTRIDVSVAVMGNAASLQGGMLQPTALLGPDGLVYAVAQGPVSIGGFSAGGSAQSVTRGVASTARITGGAIVERIPAFDFGAQSSVTLSLRNPDFSLARQVARAINAGLGVEAARMKDNANIEVTVPQTYAGRAAELVADIENLPVRPDQPAGPARIVLDERTGTVIMGEQVRLSTVAISHGNLQIRVTETPQVSQPAPFSRGGTTVVVPRTNVEVTEGSGRLVVLPSGSTIGDLVRSLNNLNVGVRDQIAILQAMRQAGAVQAEIVTGR
jgi:flagellar P-ring protein FlgI